jgi:hypothetical protein
LAASLAMV